MPSWCEFFLENVSRYFFNYDINPKNLVSGEMVRLSLISQPLLRQTKKQEKKKEKVNRLRTQQLLAWKETSVVFITNLVYLSTFHWTCRYYVKVNVQRISHQKKKKVLFLYNEEKYLGSDNGIFDRVVNTYGDEISSEKQDKNEKIDLPSEE